MKALVLALLVCTTTYTHADTEPKPWAVGVSDQEQETALAIYKSANSEFEEARYAQALEKYQDALSHWDHPAIRFNIVVCLINLTKPLEALTNLEAALKYGPEPLSPEVYNQGLTYQKLLQGQLGTLEVASKDTGAEITFDGGRLFIAPGEITKRVQPGEHQIVATKPGYITQTISVVLYPGKVSIHNIALVKPPRIVRRWPSWQPWVVVGAGTAVALVGGLFESWSAHNYSNYDEDIRLHCNMTEGCNPPAQRFLDIQDRARLENVTAISLFAVGGAAIAAGLAGVYLNQPHAEKQERFEVSPVVTPNGASVVLNGAF